MPENTHIGSFDPPPTGQDASDRSRQIQHVLDSYIDRRAAGEALADDQVIAVHPELMPELGDELRKLALIDRAQQRAHDAGSSSARADVLAEGAPPTGLPKDRWTRTR